MNPEKKIKVGVCCICLNAPYWQYANEMLWGLQTYFLKHKSIRDKYETEMMVWTDIPEDKQEISERLAHWLALRGEMTSSVVGGGQIMFNAIPGRESYVGGMINGVSTVRERGIKIFPTEPYEWPMPTLLRYNIFLQEEEYLKKFDYIFYIDVDMRITDWIGEEIFGDGLTAAQHPMYALRRNLYPPYEPNPNSAAYIKRTGRIIEDNGKKVFEPLYFAGGFQGGKTEPWIKAMKMMKSTVERDFNNNYTAIWNDESHWNKYLHDNPPAVVLDPSFIYPDSLLQEYYFKLWGRNYSPKIMTLTKPFATTQKAGAESQKMMATM